MKILFNISKIIEKAKTIISKQDSQDKVLSSKTKK